jgi:hypothetical protein
MFSTVHFNSRLSDTIECSQSLISGLYPFLRKILAGMAKKFYGETAEPAFAEASA